MDKVKIAWMPGSSKPGRRVFAGRSSRAISWSREPYWRRFPQLRRPVRGESDGALDRHGEWQREQPDGGGRPLRFPEGVRGLGRRSLDTEPRPPHRRRSSRGPTRPTAATTWNGLGEQVAFPQLDVATINATPPTAYTQVTDPSVAFDGQGNVYVLTLQTTGADDGALYLTEFNFSGGAPTR